VTQAEHSVTAVAATTNIPREI